MTIKEEEINLTGITRNDGTPTLTILFVKAALKDRSALLTNQLNLTLPIHVQKYYHH
jgi:hypothetical protein